MKIRKAKKEDLEKLAKLILDLDKFHSGFNERFKLKPDAVCLEFIKKDLRKFFKKPKGRKFLVCEENDEIFAFVCFTVDKKEVNVQDKGLWVYEIFVDRKHRREGLAKELIKKVAQVAKKNGIQELDLTYVPQNKFSSAFWNKFKAKTWSLNATIKVKDVLR